jgi:hypothetical protein
MICSVRRCEETAVIGATEVKGYHHKYCLGHLWQIEEDDQCVLIAGITEPNDYPVIDTPTSVVRPVMVPEPNVYVRPNPTPYTLPEVYPEPIYNDQGFGVGFRVVHPPGVECVFPPDTHQCSCGKIDVGIVSEDEA